MILIKIRLKVAGYENALDSCYNHLARTSSWQQSEELKSQKGLGTQSIRIVGTQSLASKNLTTSPRLCYHYRYTDTALNTHVQYGQRKMVILGT